MSKLELLRDFYAYNRYANERLLEVATPVDDSQLADVIATLAHIAAAQIVWLERWVGRVNAVPLATLQAGESLNAVVGMFETSHEGIDDYLRTLRNGDLDKTLAYKTSAGESFERPLWQLLLHVANHGSYHRGEAALMLTNLGHSPGDLDYSYWAIARDAKK